MVDPQRLKREFLSFYGQAPRLFSAPGRVNLIGEHTDYNDGFVLPFAIDRRTFVGGAARSDLRVCVRSLSNGQSIEFDLAAPGAKRRSSWSDYVEGTAQALLNAGFTVRGANLLIDSDVPPGAGLSASAALELAVGYALVRLAGSEQPDRVKLALAGQTAEHTYVGTLCGIMDQYVVALGQSENALLIDCRSLEYRLIPLALGDARILICDTKVKHELASSAYNERRRQCEEGVALIAASHPEVRALRDVTPGMLEAQAGHLPALVAKRCKHVVAENARTLAAADLLEQSKLREFGTLMNASHASLRDDYEVSCPELDEAVAAAQAELGVYGARMTGGGFGGCTVTLVEQQAVERVSEAIAARLRARFGISPAFLVTAACPGVREEAA